MTVRGRDLLILAGAVAVGVVIWLLTKEPSRGPEEEIRALIDGVVEDAEDAEDGDVGDVMDVVSERYQGEGGDRAGLRQYLTGMVLGGGIDVKVVSQQISVAGDSATALVGVLLIRGGLRGVVEGDAGTRTVRVELVREDGDWKITRGEVE